MSLTYKIASTIVRLIGVKKMFLKNKEEMLEYAKGENAKIVFDLEKAKRNFAFVGKRGEELVNEYLEQQKKLHFVESFEWMNKSRESGLPYDFILNKDQYVDVKSTRFDFSFLQGFAPLK